MSSKSGRVVAALCLGLVCPFLIGFDTHGVPAFVHSYYPVAEALWVGIRGDILVLVSSAIHLAIYGGLAFLLLTLARRRAEKFYAA